MTSALPTSSVARCPDCGTELAASRLSCPVCHRLVHREALQALAREAEAAEAADRLSEALAAWRRALELLPPQSEQARQIAARVVGLSDRLGTASVSGAPPGAPAEETEGASGRGWAAKAGGAAGAAALLLWKLKFAVLLVLSKAKLLLLGLTKAGTVLTMFLSFAVYWTVWGWRFALGLVVAMYVHEMGHVAMLRRYGIAATAPMFVPGLGAFVRLKQYPQSPREDARVGLAGPIWGLGAALFAFGLFWATGWPVLAAIARFAAWMNLFNLLPVWQLDGGRGFRPLSRTQRFMAIAVIAGTWALTREGLLVLLLLAAILQAWPASASEEGDTVALTQYAGLVLALAMLSTIHVPGAAP